METSRQLFQKIANENNYIKNHVDGFSVLTKREILVISMMVREYDVSIISEKMGIAKNTVQRYQRNIQKKLNISTVKELQKFARIFEII